MLLGDRVRVELSPYDLDTNAIAQEHPDPVPLHPPGRIADHHVPVVQPKPEHPVAEGFDDLPFHLDLLFLFADDDLLSSTTAAA